MLSWRIIEVKMPSINKFILSLTVVSFLALESAPGLAKIAEVHCIKNINEILRNLPKDGKTVAVWDWDQTISGEEGGYLPRESGAEGTLATFKALHDQGVGTIVLTARGQGLDFEEKALREIATRMQYALGKNWQTKGALKSNDLLKINYREPESGELHAFALDQIVFGGGGHKGKVITLLIDKDLFKEKLDNILFIDNDENNKNEVIKVFSNRPENIYIFYYPNPPQDPACPDSSENGAFSTVRGHLFVSHQGALENAKFSVVNASANKVIEIKTDWNGKFSFKGPTGEWQGAVTRPEMSFDARQRTGVQTGKTVKSQVKFIVDPAKAKDNVIDLGTIFID